MTWFILALSATVFWAVGQVLVKRGFEHVSPLWNNIIFYLLSPFIFISAVLWLNGPKINIPTLPIFLVMFLATASYMIFYYALSKGKLALTGTVVAGYPVATVVLSYLFLGERLVGVQILGIFLALLGVLAVSLPEKSLPQQVRDFSWLKWGLAAALLIGVGDFLAKISINQVGSYSQVFITALLALPLLAINYLIDKKGRPKPSFQGRRFLPALLGNGIMALGSLTFALALGQEKAALVVPVSSVYPALMAILAAIFLKERITLKQALGIASVVVGIMVVGMGSV